MQWLALLVGLSLAKGDPSCASSLEQLPFELAELAGVTCASSANADAAAGGPRLEKRGLKCWSCQHLLGTLKGLPKEKAHSIAESYIRKNGAHVSELPPINFAKDMLNALSVMDPYGEDGRYMCHFLMGRACELPATPQHAYEFPERLPVQPRESRGKTFNALHISDIHLQLNYTVGAAANCLDSMCCGPNSVRDPLMPGLPAPAYGSFKCDSPEVLMQSALDSIAASPQTYQFALFTGDMVDHDPLFMSQSLCVAEEEVTLKALKSYLDEMPVYAVLGNHDTYPFSQDAADWTGFADKFSFNSDLMSLLAGDAGWLGQAQQDQIRRHHGAYSVEARPGLQVIAINTNFWYSWNFYNYARTGDVDPSGMLSFVVEELQKCEQSGRRAWIIGHVPPGGLTHETLPMHSEHFSAILERYKDTIAATFFGHTHRDEFTVLYGNNATVRSEEHALMTAYMAPSITPYTDLNPGWRYYEIDADTFEVMDVVTMYADLDAYKDVLSPVGTPMEWRQGYSARQYYGQHPLVQWPQGKPLNAKFWHRVAHAMIADPEMAERYNRMASRLSPRTGACNDECRTKQYCYVTSMTTPQAMACRAEFKERRRLWTPSDKWQPMGRAGAGIQKILS